MEYLAFVMLYVTTQPIDGDLTGPNYGELGVAKEVILWTLNWSMIMFELQEFYEKGTEESWSAYFNLRSQTPVNAMDTVISFLWIFLFSVRMRFIALKTPFVPGAATDWQKTYIFIFAFQIIMLTVRVLLLFSNSSYLGTMVRAIKLVIMMCGFLFGIWFISAANQCDNADADDDDCGDFEVEDLRGGLIYVFGVFIGTGDLGGVADESLGIAFMIIATLFGTLILTNLLIALMTTQYENVQEEAKYFVIYNQAETTYDLTRRSRLLPPPMNIVVVVLMVLLNLFNVVVTLIRPTWNMYNHVGRAMFTNLQKCKCSLRSKHRNRRFRWRSDLWRCGFGKNRKIYHKACYGALILENEKKKRAQWRETWKKGTTMCTTLCTRQSTDVRDAKRKGSKKKKKGAKMKKRARRGIENETFNHCITMSSYFERYERERRQKIEAHDRRLLMGLTGNILFCEHCYRPFLESEGSKELISAYSAMQDYVSAILFVAIPIAYIPLILLFLGLMLKQRVMELFYGDSAAEAELEEREHFDKQYVPRNRTFSNLHMYKFKGNQ